MPRLDYRGGAAKCTASGAVAIDATSVNIDGDTSGWPTGASGRNFVATIDRGVAGKMEKVLCSDLTGGVLTIATRGFDGTVAVTHDANATVEHGIHAGFFDDMSSHVYDETRDDHTQYVRTDGSRFFDDVTPITDAPVPIAAALSAGTAQTLARSDHAHTIPNASITAAKFAPGAVGAATIEDGSITSAKLADLTIQPGDIADDAITTTKLQDLAVTEEKLAGGVVPVIEFIGGAVSAGDKDVTSGSFADYSGISGTSTPPDWATRALVETTISGTSVTAASNTRFRTLVGAAAGLEHLVSTNGDSGNEGVTYTDEIALLAPGVLTTIKLQARRGSGTGAYRMVGSIDIVSFKITYLP